MVGLDKIEKYTLDYRRRDLNDDGGVIGYTLRNSKGEQIYLSSWQLKQKLARHRIEVEGLVLNADATITDKYVIDIGNKVANFLNKCKILGINIQDYKFSDDYGVLLEYTGRDDEVRMPPVEAIGHHCFSYAGYETFNGPSKKNIKMVRIPKDVKMIAKEAFYNSRVEDVVIEGDIIELGVAAFAGCGHLKEVRFKGSLDKIGSGCFQRSTIVRLELPDTVKVIPNEMAKNCYWLKEVVMREGITSIGLGAFSDCGDLENIVVPSTVKEIRDNAFYTGMNVTQAKDMSVVLKCKDFEQGENCFIGRHVIAEN